MRNSYGSDVSSYAVCKIFEFLDLTLYAVCWGARIVGVAGRGQLVKVIGGQAEVIAMVVLSSEILNGLRSRDKEICWWTRTLDTNKRKDTEKTLNFTLEKKMRHWKPNQIKTKQDFCFLFLESKGKNKFLHLRERNGTPRLLSLGSGFESGLSPSLLDCMIVGELMDCVQFSYLKRDDNNSTYFIKGFCVLIEKIGVKWSAYWRIHSNHSTRMGKANWSFVKLEITNHFNGYKIFQKPWRNHSISIIINFYPTQTLSNSNT